MQEGIADEFVKRFSEAAARMTAGNPLDESTKPPTIISQQHAEVIMNYLETGRKEGANSTHYGLSADIYTRDYDTVMHAARRPLAGTVWINT